MRENKKTPVYVKRFAQPKGYRFDTMLENNLNVLCLISLELKFALQMH